MAGRLKIRDSKLYRQQYKILGLFQGKVFRLRAIAVLDEILRCVDRLPLMVVSVPVTGGSPGVLFINHVSDLKPLYRQNLRPIIIGLCDKNFARLAGPKLLF